MKRIINFILLFTFVFFLNNKNVFSKETEDKNIKNKNTENTENLDNTEKKEKKIGLYYIISDAFSKVWHSDIYDFYLPVNTWHNRAMYDKEKTDTYNEKPYGFGIGKTRYDEKGNKHQLYIMGFQDSHDKFEPIFGYNYQWMWYFGKNKDFSGGFGITANITMRHEYNYIPLPLPLPMASISYKWFSIESAYIPGGYNGGNVLFTWLRFSFKM